MVWTCLENGQHQNSSSGNTLGTERLQEKARMTEEELGRRHQTRPQERWCRERQSAWMSKITNDGLTRSGTVGVKGLNCYQASKIPVKWWSLLLCCGISHVMSHTPGWWLCSPGAQGLPRVADEYAESQVSGLHPAERVQDDCGATSRHQGELAAFLLKLHRWLPQLLHHRQQCRRETVRWTQPPVQTPPAGTVSFKPSSSH